MNLQVSYPDPEAVVRPVLADLVDVPVGVARPNGWTPADGPCITVAWDGTPRITHPIVAWPTVRVTAHAATTTEAKNLAAEALGLLAASELSFTPLTVTAPATDPDDHTIEMSSFTGRLTTRSQPLTGS